MLPQELYAQLHIRLDCHSNDTNKYLKEDYIMYFVALLPTDNTLHLDG